MSTPAPGEDRDKPVSRPAELRTRWERGERLSVEDFLDQMPAFLAQDELIRDLIRNELQARLEQGEFPDLEEYVDRFPRFEAELRRWLYPGAADPTLRAGGPRPTPTPAGGPAGSRDGSLPERFGRYRVLARLGSGSFGTVYRGHDDELQREVAIKVSHPERIVSPEDVRLYLEEGRVLAELDHPGIVPVYDLGRQDDDGRCYLVTKFVRGSDLAALLHQGRVPVTRAAALAAAVAEALHHAHQRGLVHRDVKPANILINEDGSPVVSDFGLALREQDVGKGPACAGTPAYMSPEQARQEGHLVDGRTDVYSLGVVLYEMLTGERPFRADGDALIEQIKLQDPRPPRQIDDTIPRELDRICLRALNKRASDRYSTASDLAEDLRHWLSAGTRPDAGARPPPPAAPPAGRAPIHLSDSKAIARVVPKGLRSFDEGDADFFLELLPGPRDRDGLPDSVRFWKARLEETDPDRTFRVGLLYGPSGCGKSSLVKAGLLPRLAGHVRFVYAEAAPEGTEARLLRGLRKSFPSLPAEASLTEALTRLRRGQYLAEGDKVVLVLDQLEQWLHAHSGQPDTELARALRQCDGRVQALLLVRDDFWMSTTSLLRQLEVPLLEGQNAAAMDLFEPRHARRVLASFGRAYGALPEGTLETEQEQFLDRAVAELAPEGKVVPVRLSVFAQMAQSRPWTPATLRAVGGAGGLGVTFLEETFGDRATAPLHRQHRDAARAVLGALLPEEGKDLRGRVRSHQALLAASGYERRPAEFDDLVRMLDTELRLITPADPDETGPGAPDRCYQLSHDYLVRALRQWLTARQRQTRRGRAELRLAERAALWSSRPENRNLPSPLEWAGILLLARRAVWTEPQRRMMSAASRHYAAWGGLVAALFVALLAGVLWARSQVRARTYADGLVSKLLVAPIDRVPEIVDQLADYRPWADPALQRTARDTEAPPGERLRARLALLPVDDSHVLDLADSLLAAGPDELPVVRRLLEPWQAKVTDRLWERLEAETEPAQKLRAACALAAYDPASRRWEGMAEAVAAQLIRENRPEWVTMLWPARRHLLEPLGRVYRGQVPAEQAIATTILADYAAAEPAFLAELVKDADPGQYEQLARALDASRGKAAASMRAELDRRLPADAKDAAKERLARRQANAAVTLYRAGEGGPLWPLLRHSPDPRLRTHLIHGLAALGASPGLLAERWAVEQDVSARRALLLALGEFPADRLPAEARKRLIDEAGRACRDHPDPGLRSAAEWLLRQWRKEDRLLRPSPRKDRAPGQTWYVNHHGHTMVVTDGRGHPAAAAARGQRLYSISTREVSIEQFLGFRPDRHHLAPPGTAGDYPVNVVRWFEAAAYCRWLSEQEGIPEDQMCYPKVEDIKPGMTLPANYLERTGYRLPTEWEWEQAARAGATTARFFGESELLLPRYAWFNMPPDRIRLMGRLKPNDLGLFDVLGNIMEWCHGDAEGDPREDGRDVEVVRGDSPRVARGAGIHHRAESVRCAHRDSFPATLAWHSIGFRVARTEPPRP